MRRSHSWSSSLNKKNDCLHRHFSFMLQNAYIFILAVVKELTIYFEHRFIHLFIEIKNMVTYPVVQISLLACSD